MTVKTTSTQPERIRLVRGFAFGPLHHKKEGSMSESETRSKTFEWEAPTLTRSMLPNLTGLQYVEGIRDGTIPAPPMAVLIGATVLDVKPGMVTFTSQPAEEHLNPLGSVHGGFICTLLDTVAGCAAHTTLPAGVGYTSIEIKVNYMRPVNAEGGPITASGTVTKGGSRVVFVDAVAWDAEHRVVATASSSLLVLSGRGV